MNEIMVEYYSNNSGGGDWLKKKDWDALEKAGWHTYGFNNFEYGLDRRRVKDPDGYPVFVGKKGRMKYANKKFDSIQQALQEFESLTGQDVSDEGCNCCGAPHEFSWDGGYASGEDLLPYLYPDKKNPKSLREAIE